MTESDAPEAVHTAAKNEGIDVQWVTLFLACCEPLSGSDDAVLRALREKAPSKGKGGVVVSRRFGNLLVNWDTALKEGTKVTGTAGATYGVALSLKLAVLTGAAIPWAAVGGAVLGLLICWRALRALPEVELSREHARIVYFLWDVHKDAKVTLADIHEAFDADLGATKVSAILTDLGDLGLIAYGVGEIERRTHLVLTPV